MPIQIATANYSTIPAEYPPSANCCYYLKNDQNIQRTAREDGCFTGIKCCCFTLNILAAPPSFYFTSRHSQEQSFTFCFMR